MQRLVGAAVAALLVAAPLSAADSAKTIPVSLIKLIANPERYHGKRVRVDGYLHVKFEDSGIYLSKLDEDHLNARNGLWISYAGKVMRQVSRRSKGKATSNKYFDCKMVLVEGVFNKDSRGHLGAWSGELKGVYRLLERTRWFDGARVIKN